MKRTPKRNRNRPRRRPKLMDLPRSSIGKQCLSKRPKRRAMNDVPRPSTCKRLRLQTAPQPKPSMKPSISRVDRSVDGNLTRRVPSQPASLPPPQLFNHAHPLLIIYCCMEHLRINGCDDLDCEATWNERARREYRLYSEMTHEDQVAFQNSAKDFGFDRYTYMSLINRFVPPMEGYDLILDETSWASALAA